MMTFKHDIAEFFAAYVDAFVGKDVKALSELWDAVGLFPSPKLRKTGRLAG
jgi:hypothetical protein